MANTGSLRTDQLFKGLTRPATVFGVSFTFAVLNVVISLFTYVLTSKLSILILFMPTLHAVGYIICFYEPLFVELFIVKNQKCNKCKNKLFHGANSYNVII